MRTGGRRNHDSEPSGTVGPRHPSDRYKWVALSNTTLGVLMATLDASIMLIAMPDIFRGIQLDPLQPGNSFYLLWMILSFLIVSSVLVVSLGRLGRHLRPGADVQPRLRHLHRRLAHPHRRLADRAGPVPSTSSSSASCRASGPPSSSPTPRRS